MKALAILAGPRKGYATDNVTDSVLRGLKDGGAGTEKVYLYDLDIKPCRGCLACEKTRQCVIEDDNQPLLEKVKVSDVVVFASPTYWSNVTSTAKAFFDRGANLFEMTKLGPKRLKKSPSRVILITSCGAPFPFSQFMGIIPGCMRAMKVFFKRMNVKIKTITAAGMLTAESRPGEKLLKKAYNLGKETAGEK